MSDRWLTVREAADYLGVTPRGFYRTAVRRGLPHGRYGRKRLFKVSVLDRFVELERQRLEGHATPEEAA
ncbi:MAG: helix-turn-helix domain-containing protein [Rhodospirillaceae bacterium]